MGELLGPLPGLGLSGSCLPRDPRRNNHSGSDELWSLGFSSHNNYGALSLQGPGCSGGGVTDLLSSGQESPCCPLPSWSLPVPGKAPNPGLCLWPPGSWIHGPGTMQSPFHGAATQAPWSRRPNPSELLLGPHSSLHVEPLPLLELPMNCSLPCSPLSVEPLPVPLQAFPGAAQHPPCGATSRVALSGSRVQPCVSCSPLGSPVAGVAHSPRGPGVC